MNKSKIKNIVIVLLSVIVIILSVISFLKPNIGSKASSLLKDFISLQSKTSEYIGKMKSDTFGIYTTEQILIGSIDIAKAESTKILNNNDEEVKSLVDVKNSIKNDENTYYVVNKDNISKIFQIELGKYTDTNWYIDTNGNIRLKYIERPTWWTAELDSILVGN